MTRYVATNDKEVDYAAALARRGFESFGPDSLALDSLFGPDAASESGISSCASSLVLLSTISCGSLACAGDESRFGTWRGILLLPVLMRSLSAGCCELEV